MEGSMRTKVVRALAVAGLLLAATPVLAQAGPGGGGGMARPAMMLQQFDSDGDGKVSQEEFRAGHDQRFSTLDADGNGQISREEFATRAPQPPAPKPPRAERMFSRMDANADGTVSRDEFDAWSTQGFARHDANGDGVISADEFARGRGGKGPGGGCLAGGCPGGAAQQ
jgi:Ca2+-binding EF-hand superfamily protein